MSCCCHTPSAAALAAAIIVLVITVPGAFFSMVSLFFGYEQLEHPALRILYVVALLLGALGAVCGLFGRGWSRPHACLLNTGMCFGALSFLLSIASIIWSCAVVGQADNTTEGVVVGVGSILIFSVPVFLVPLAWMSYELHAVSRQAAGQKPLFAPVGQYNPYVAQGMVSPAMPVSQDPYGAQDTMVPGGLESTSHSMGHVPTPYGRARRGSRSSRRGEYASTSRGGGMSESEGSLLSSDDDAYSKQRQARKSRSSLGQY